MGGQAGEARRMISRRSMSMTTMTTGNASHEQEDDNLGPRENIQEPPWL